MPVDLGALGQDHQKSIASDVVADSLTLFPPIFDGRIFTRQRAREMAEECEGDTLADSGGLPRGYEAYDPSSRYWRDVQSYERGYAYLTVGNCDEFTVYILADDPDLLELEDVETYCGKAIVTQIDGVMQQRAYACDEGGASLKLTMKWRITVFRMLESTGALQKAVRGTIYTEAWFANRWHGDFGHVSIDYVVSSDVKGYPAPLMESSVVGTRAPSSSELSGLGSDSIQKTISAHALGCAGLGASLVTVLIDRLFEVWSSSAASVADASGSYYGPPACDVTHAVYLLRKSPVFEDCQNWISDICAECPFDCGDIDIGTPGDDMDIPKAEEA